jgi:hypothetical protein
MSNTLQHRFLSTWFEREGVTTAEFSHLSYNCQNAVRIITQDDEHWEGWKYEGVLNFTYNGKGYQVLKSMHNYHY